MLCTVYLLWDLIDVVTVQEKLYDAFGYTAGHLCQDIASQIELNKSLQVLESGCTQVTVRQLRDTRLNASVQDRRQDDFKSGRRSMWGE